MNGSDWSPSDRLSLINALAALAGSESAALFQAFGLGAAYNAPGEGAGKKAKIVSGMNAAETRGILGEVLGAAARLVSGPPNTVSARSGARLEAHEADTTGSPQSGGIAMPRNRRVFVSHSSRDDRLIRLFMDSLAIGGVRDGAVFSSSTPGSGIGAGKDVLAGLRSALDDAELLVELLTENYLKSTMCVMEYGAAWATQKRSLPIVFEPLTRREAIAALGNVQMHKASSPQDIDNFFDELHAAVEAATGDSLTMSTWNRGRAHFKEQLAAL